MYLFVTIKCFSLGENNNLYCIWKPENTVVCNEVSRPTSTPMCLCPSFNIFYVVFPFLQVGFISLFIVLAIIQIPQVQLSHFPIDLLLVSVWSSYDKETNHRYYKMCVFLSYKYIWLLLLQRHSGCHSYVDSVTFALTSIYGGAARFTSFYRNIKVLHSILLLTWF